MSFLFHFFNYSLTSLILHYSSLIDDDSSFLFSNKRISQRSDLDLDLNN